MKKNRFFQKILLSMAGGLIIVHLPVFGALDDEIAALTSSLQGQIMNHETEIDIEAQRLAGTYGSELIPFTGTHFGKVDPAGRNILLRAITRLPDRAAVQDALYSLAMAKSGLLHEDVITAIFFCDPDEAVNVALRLAKNTKSRQVGNSALALMEIFGNDAAVSSLEQLEKSIDDEQYKKAIAAARKNIEERMNFSATAQRDWDLYAQPYWRIPREIPLIRSVVMSFFRRNCSTGGAIISL